MSQAWAFNLLDDGGDETARALGVNVKRTRLLCGGSGNSAYSLCSQLHRYHWFRWPGSASYGTYAHWRRLPSSASLFAVTGAFLVLAADTLGRNAFSPTTVPVGIVVSYVGVPLFLYLILRERRKSPVMEKKNVIGNGTKTENGNENGSGIGMGTANDLEVSGIKFHYGKREILKGTGFCARRGEVCLLLGANGAGKSTLLKCIQRSFKSL